MTLEQRLLAIADETALRDRVRLRRLWLLRHGAELLGAAFFGALCIGSAAGSVYLLVIRFGVSSKADPLGDAAFLSLTALLALLTAPSAWASRRLFTAARASPLGRWEEEPHRIRFAAGEIADARHLYGHGGRCRGVLVEGTFTVDGRKVAFFDTLGERWSFPGLPCPVWLLYADDDADSAMLAGIPAERLRGLCIPPGPPFEFSRDQVYVAVAAAVLVGLAFWGEALVRAVSRVLRGA